MDHYCTVRYTSQSETAKVITVTKTAFHLVPGGKARCCCHVRR
ncbi:hypothetical protein YPPY113_3681 [Yersinia pestis PY-113]|nr:hypothetical protein YPPY113_3681 [Yersinia pestis PY-113]